jgi:hypothetical protein
MEILTRRAMRVTVALAELRHSKGDVLDPLIPFFEPILDVLSGKVFDPALLSAGVRKLYRWRFTTDVAEQFIPRLVGKGYLRREGRGANALYVVTYQPVPDADAGADGVAETLKGVIDRSRRSGPW